MFKRYIGISNVWFHCIGRKDLRLAKNKQLMSHDYNYTFVIPTILYPQKTEINRLHLNVFPTIQRYYPRL